MKKKKGFTLVELLVVIAILAVLATVSVVGYMGFTKKAHESNDIGLTTQMNTILQAEEVTNKPTTPHDAVKQLANGGVDVEKLTPTTDGYNYVYDLDTNRMFLLDDNRAVVAPTNIEYTVDLNVFAFVGSESEITNWNSYSVYLKSGFTFNNSKTLTLSTGLDVGDNEIDTINYERKNATNKQTVLIRTTNGLLNIDAEKDTINHYGEISAICITNCDKNSFHEFGEVNGNITLKTGRVVLENNSKINSIILDTSSIENIAIVQNENAMINGTIIALDENVKNNLTNSSSIQVKSDVINAASNVVLINNENENKLKTFLDEEKYCLLTSDIKFDYNLFFTNKNFILDLNNYTLTFYTITLSNKSNGSIKNGKLITTNKTLNSGSILIKDENKLEITGVEFLAEKSCGLFPHEKSEIILKNTKVKAALFALGTNASESQVNSPLISISATNCEFVTESSDYDNTSLYINVPVTAYFERCSFEGGRQAVFVRGGNVTFKDCNLTVSGNFSPINKYFDTVWGTGNELPTSALTIGNRGTSNSYNYSTSVTLLNTKLEVTNNKDKMYALYAYGLTKDNYTVTISYDTNSNIGRNNLDDDIGNVIVSRI